MAGDARALFADGLLGDLDQDFLTFLQQVGDERLIAAVCWGGCGSCGRVHHHHHHHDGCDRAAAPLVAWTVRLPLLVPRCGSRSAYLGAIARFLFFALFFLFLFVAIGVDLLATLFGSDDLVFVNVFNLRHPAFGQGAGRIESFFLED